MAEHCLATHTKYDPSTDDFNCPECGAKAGDFAIDEPVDDVAKDCERLHNGDYLRCYKCGFNTTGRAFAQRLTKKNSLVPCEHCKGRGMVKRTP